MTNPDLGGLMPYSVIMAGKPGSNPIIVAGKAHQSSSIARISIPKGVSHVQLTSTYKGATTLVLVDGERQRDVQWWRENPGGINVVEAATDSAYIYLRASQAQETDTFSFVIMPIPAQD